MTSENGSFEFQRNWRVAYGPVLANLDRIWPKLAKLGQAWPEFDNTLPKLINIGPSFANEIIICAILVQLGPDE